VLTRSHASCLGHGPVVAHPDAPQLARVFQVNYLRQLGLRIGRRVKRVGWRGRGRVGHRLKMVGVVAVAVHFVAHGQHPELAVGRAGRVLHVEYAARGQVEGLAAALQTHLVSGSLGG